MAFYETVFIARQELSAAQVETLAAQLTGIITEGQGEVAKTEFCGLRTLAYSIKKNRKGHYVLFNSDAPPAALQEMERQMRLNEDILRFMTIRLEKIDSNPSALMQSKNSRDSRDSRERRHDSFGEHGDSRERRHDSFGEHDRRDVVSEQEIEILTPVEGDKE